MVWMEISRVIPYLYMKSFKRIYWIVFLWREKNHIITRHHHLHSKWTLSAPDCQKFKCDICLFFSFSSDIEIMDHVMGDGNYVVVFRFIISPLRHLYMRIMTMILIVILWLAKYLGHIRHLKIIEKYFHGLWFWTMSNVH